MFRSIAAIFRLLQFCSKGVIYIYIYIYIYVYTQYITTKYRHAYIYKLNSVALVRERTIPTERPPPVGEVSANFCG